MLRFCSTVVLLAAGVCAQVAPPQGRFAAAAKQHFPVMRMATNAVALGDIDGDGDVDAVLGNSDVASVLLANDGNGVFLPDVGLPSQQAATYALVLGDVDGDRDLDLVSGNDAQQDRLYLNDGAGRFTDVTTTHMPPDTQSARALAFGDVDGDADLDLVIVNLATIRLYLNDGAGRFTDATAGRLSVPPSTVFAVALRDVDGDLDLDLVFGRYGGQTALYLNDGLGMFTDATPRLPQVVTATLAVALGDVDADGDADLVLGNFGQNRLYLNDGLGTFADATSQLPVATDFTNALTLADLDGDGDLDLACGNLQGPSWLYVNDGTGRFADATATRLPPILEATNALAAADLDADQDLDLVFANTGQSRVYLSHGGGRFADACADQLPARRQETGSLVAGDVDGDGDLDLVAGGALGSSPDQLYVNDGKGGFAAGVALPVDGDITLALALGDVDSDGDSDLVLGNDQTCGPFGCRGGQNRLYRNDGSGRFTDTTSGSLPADTDGTFAVFLLDLDGDRDLDLLTGNSDQVRRYDNNGSGTFTDVTASTMPGGGCLCLAVGDVDGDLDADLVLGVSGQNNLWLNAGTGVFVDATSGRLPILSDRTHGVALVDVDGDRDLDLVFANAWSQQDRLLLNDGSGRFLEVTATRLPLDNDSASTLAAGDVDGDGDADLVIGNFGTNNRLYGNDGTGTFSDLTALDLPSSQDYPLAVVLADLDADDDLDLVWGNYAADRLLLNRLRQTSVPFLVMAGRAYTLDLHARPGFATTVNLVVPVVASAELITPLPPWGTFGLDPAFSIVLPAVAIPPSGQQTLVLALPADPALVGLMIHAQALAVHGPVTAHFTAVTSDTIR